MDFSGTLCKTIHNMDRRKHRQPIGALEGARPRQWPDEKK
jgi:hypothetical protein